MPDMNKFYGGGDEAESEQAPASQDAKPDEKEGQEEGNPIVFNKESCPDCKPGDVLTVTVKAVHDEEIEGMVTKADEGEGEDQPQETPEEGGGMPEGPPGGGGGMASMM